MKKLMAIAVVLFTASLVKAQYNKDIIPKSFESINQVTEAKTNILTPFNAQQAAELDFKEGKNGTLPHFARHIACNLNLNNSTFSQTKYKAGSEEGILYTAKIISAGAKGLVVLFSNLYIPDGAMLHVYSADKKQVLGAYTHSNTPEPTPFNAGIIYGESCTIEYYEPISQAGNGVLDINQIGHGYRWLNKPEVAANAIASDPCEVNVACSEASGWANQVRAVARILVVDAQGEGYCTGTLVNNTQQNCMPYFLSAQHCSEGVTTAQYGQWVFYFNYQANACNGTTGTENQTINGCTKIADSNDNGGDNGSDFLLLKLNSTPPTAYNVYYAGWNNQDVAPAEGVAIHHPDGDIKKISTYTDAPSSTTWGGTVADTHWDVQWVQTTNGHGVTEPGSSGAALFDTAGLIVGTLTGGDSYCVQPDATDQFGKVAYHWIQNGSANNRRLKPWLDPINSNVTKLSGTNPPCGIINSINENSTNATSLVVSPNPGTGVFNLKFTNEAERNIQVYDYLGQLIGAYKTAGNTFTLNLNNVNRGIYLLQVEAGGLINTQKLVVE